ncbi:ATP-binding protein [Henriciella sp.]|uniref:ATP-binding protein n=1 Tax=Henriciella sp. TaxID=1968823 RepID=UPI0026108AA5|nr:ATP-binding protein [Henriciella sp.]
MKELELPPRASALSQSMRDLGYSLETAIADIIDNSIAAGASAVDIWCDPSDNDPSLAIVDDGSGMDEETLIEAMRYGSRDPGQARKSTDLGRFGLGMKTASFSQCRELTVVSRRGNQQTAAQWDLDRLAQDAWKIGLLDDGEVKKLSWLDELPETGTMVLWKKLDRMSEQKTGAAGAALLTEKLALLENHLSLVFHRFLPASKSASGKLVIHINGHPVTGFDPFCRSNPATTALPPQHVRIRGHRIPIQAYVLPHHSMLSRSEYDFYRSRSDFISNQGAYIYRNDRLMAWGDWFRMIPKGEATKLARVEIDFPAELDEEWTIDIKKSRAHPP